MHIGGLKLSRHENPQGQGSKPALADGYCRTPGAQAEIQERSDIFALEA